jgi:hypothetical protein
VKYPQIISEETTLGLMLAGNSISRFGDGELRCAIGGACTSQRNDSKLASELKAVLLDSTTDRFMVGLPNTFDGRGAPRKESWAKYTEPQFTNLLRKGVFHSSFITRPDNAPWIDTPKYWADVRKLWADQDVILVAGEAKDGSGAERKSLNADMIQAECRSFSLVIGPRQHAYEKIDELEWQITRLAGATPGARVLLCLGTCATVLAWRLAKRGIHALDVGHIGMFLRHAGAYRYAADDLTSVGYRRQLETLHSMRSWGADGEKHAQVVKKLIEQTEPATILDYGCGENRLAEALKPILVSGYDPGIPERSKMPKPCDMVVCTDVLEHVEPERVESVIDHIFRLTGKTAYLVISTKPANAILPDGRNAHLTVQPAERWLELLTALNWKVQNHQIGKNQLEVTLTK